MKGGEQKSKTAGPEWLRIAVIWILFGVGYATQTFIEMQSRGMHHSYLRMVSWGLEIGIFWALLTPFILRLAYRFPLERPRLQKSLLVHAPIFLAVSLVGGANHVASAMLINPFAPMSLDPSFFVNYARQLGGYFPLSFFMYGSIVAVGHAMEYRRRFHERELQAAQLETLLAQAQVQSLKSQLHPHFLFNTLNGVVAFVREGEKDAAVSILVGLSNMLRYALENSNRQLVPLSEELEFLKMYLGIERMRFPDRLTVSFEIAPDVLDASVPAMLLQPLVENAVRHGIAPRLSPGHITIQTNRVDSHLVLTVLDDGDGLPETSLSDRTGIGLENTRERLLRLYGMDQELSVTNRSSGGVESRVILPFRRVATQGLVSA